MLALVLGACDTSSIEPIRQKLAAPGISPSAPIPVVGERPNAQQLEWQRGEMYMFVHYGINTFTGAEWGEGNDSPAVFSPTVVDARQWVSVAKDAGFRGLIFTAKHHDGFALWPSSVTEYSIQRSTWKNGKGDIVRDVAEAANEASLQFGIYVSPWDRNAPSYGTLAYNDLYAAQLSELLSNYGPVFEVWIDGAYGGSIEPPYDYARFYSTIRTIQPEALIFGGPDILWVGNESGVAPETNWSTANDGSWQPFECDVSIRPGWFWKSEDDTRVKSTPRLLNIYFSSIGRNCVLLLNVPPNKDGVIPSEDVQTLRSFRAALDNIFRRNLAEGSTVSATNTRGDEPSWGPANILDGRADTFWATDDGLSEASVDIRFGRTLHFNTVDLKEPIQFGQRLEYFRIESKIERTESWLTLAEGTTIGYRRIIMLPPTSTNQVRITIRSRSGPPALQKFALYDNYYSDLMDDAH